MTFRKNTQISFVAIFFLVESFTHSKKSCILPYNRLNVSIYEQHVSRTIFMVIDALRIDFIQNNKNTSMKYLNKLIAEESACQNDVQVNSPTVTMPRIKVTSNLYRKAIPLRSIY